MEKRLVIDDKNDDDDDDKVVVVGLLGGVHPRESVFMDLSLFGDQKKVHARWALQCAGSLRTIHQSQKERILKEACVARACQV